MVYSLQRVLVNTEIHTCVNGQTRADKAERLKDVGSPIALPGIALDIKIVGNDAWIAENTSVIRKVDLEVRVLHLPPPPS